MNDNEYIAGVINVQLEKGSPLVLASIISLQGSSPRHNGTKMVVGANGRSYGTIGGSLLEATAIKESLRILTGKQSKIMDFELSGKNAQATGMICGGKARVFLDYIPATKENQEFFRSWYDSILQGSDFFYLTLLKDADGAINVVGRSLLYPDGKTTGNGPLMPADIDNLRTELHNISLTSVIPLRDMQVVIDPIRKLKTLYCFGAGHVALPTAHIAAMVGFRVVVIDDRVEFANVERFPDAYDVRVIEDFNHALQGLEIDSDSFIVIVTRGHQYDRVVLEQALKTKAGYIGMISSRRKREAIYEALMAVGVTREELERVHSPIGIAIGGETPEEIAVSIVAELISVRMKQQA